MQSSSVSQIKQITQRGFRASLLFAALVLGANGAAQASSLGLTPGIPDIFSSSITTGYASGVFTANGIAMTIDDDGIGPSINFDAIVANSFSLTAMIDGSGSLSSGSISITGSITSLSATSGTLLTGTLTDIGFPDAGGNPLEFLFDVTGGDLASLYGGLGGVILSGSGLPISSTPWANDFSNNGRGLSDTFSVVPVPAAVWLFGSALLGLAGFGRHSRRKQA